jgi:hypothetical protein
VLVALRGRFCGGACVVALVLVVVTMVELVTPLLLLLVSVPLLVAVISLEDVDDADGDTGVAAETLNDGGDNDVTLIIIGIDVIAVVLL